MAVLAAGSFDSVFSETQSQINAVDGSRMVLVPAGPFVMGTHLGAAEETPPHSVDLPAYYIDAEEVTTEQYARYIAATGAAAPADWTDGKPPKGRDKLPITNITWPDAMRYAVWAGKRLPTEAEWEKAARGTDGRLFPWGDADDPARREPRIGKTAARRAVCYGGLALSDASICRATRGNGRPTGSRVIRRRPRAARTSASSTKSFAAGGAWICMECRTPGPVPSGPGWCPTGRMTLSAFAASKTCRDKRRPMIRKRQFRRRKSDWMLPFDRRESCPSRPSSRNSKKSDESPSPSSARPDRKGLVRTGFPFPEGMISNPRFLRLLGPFGKPAADCRLKLLSQWADDSARWVLLEFIANAGEVYGVWN